MIKKSFYSKVSKIVGKCRSRNCAPGFVSDKISYFDVILLFVKTDRFIHAAWLEPNIKTRGFILFFVYSERRDLLVKLNITVKFLFFRIILLRLPIEYCQHLQL